MGRNVEGALTEIEAPQIKQNFHGLELWQRLVTHGLLLKEVNTGKVVHVICDHSLENIEKVDELMKATIIIMDGDNTYGCYGVEHPIDSRNTREGTMIMLDDTPYYVLNGNHCVLR